MAFYVSHYQEYPIYEPAEGGYYYAGNTLVSSTRYQRPRDAMRAFIRKGQAYGMDRCGEQCFIERGRYIGENERLIIERVKGSEVSGWHPYE